MMLLDQDFFIELSRAIILPGFLCSERLELSEIQAEWIDYL